MSDDKIPEWLEILKCYNGPNSTIFYNGMDEAFRILSKPQNAAKLECVRELIEAAKKMRLDCYVSEGIVFDDIEQALKPFEPKESDE